MKMLHNSSGWICSTASEWMEKFWMLSFNEQKQCGDWMAVEHSQPGQNVIEKAKSAMVLFSAKGHESLDSSNQER